MPVKASIKTLLDKNAKTVIDELKEIFDSHDFILGLIKKDEKGYVEELYKCINSKNGIFRNFHSQIGRYLSEESKKANSVFNSTGRIKSDNIKDYLSENEEWKKK